MKKLLFPVVICCAIAFCTIFGAGCSSCDNQYAKIMQASLPSGVVTTGPVVLDSFQIELELPTSVFAQVNKQGQWLANAEYGAFRIMVAQVADSAHKKSPATFVRNRLKQLTKLTIEPTPVDSALLARTEALSGYIIRHQQQNQRADGSLLDSRTYAIIGLRYEYHILVISADTYDPSFDDPEVVVARLIDSIQKPTEEEQHVDQ